jgi:hypothetical protein
MKKFFILTLIFLAPSFADAATLYLSPSSGSYVNGKAFTVNVYVSSPSESMNAVSANIGVDTSKFSIVSASSVGSVVNFWVQQPAVSGSSISFEGVVLNPGYQGSGAKVASFVLLPKATGSGSVSFSSASVLANDGQGTNILDSSTGATYSIQEAVVETPRPAPTVTPKPKEETTSEEEAPPVSSAPGIEIPQVTNYNDHISFGDLVALRGVTYENSTLEVLVYESGSLVTTEYAVSNSSGDFSMVLAKRLSPGTYQLFVRVTTTEGFTSEAAGPFAIKVDGGVFSALEWVTVGHLALLVLGLLAIVGALSILHALGFRKLFSLSRELHESHTESTDMARRVFGILKKDLANHVKSIRTAGETRLLTNEELSFLKDFEDELEQAETALRPKRKKKTTT